MNENEKEISRIDILIEKKKKRELKAALALSGTSITEFLIKKIDAFLKNKKK